MGHKIGIIGPSWSVERILKVAEEFQQEIEFKAFTYLDVLEAQKIVVKNDHLVDAWLFSGELPFRAARASLAGSKAAAYIPHTESSFYKCFLDLAYESGALLERLSIDMLKETTIVQETFQQLSKPPGVRYVEEYECGVDPEALISFHLKLWEKGETDGALTCFPAVHKALSEAGVPVSAIMTSRMEIRQTLRILIEKVKTSFFKDTQIGVEIIEMEFFDRVIEKATTPYHLQYLELRLKEILYRLCEKLDGSLLDRGNGRYVIFSSRGAIEREITALKQTVQQLSLESGTSAAVGIGFGTTVFSAETNAHRAIQQSKETAESGIVIVQENGIMIESAGNEEELAYTFRTSDKDFMEKLKSAGISIKTYNKIEALVQRKGWHDFTSKDLSVHLGMTERNVRRIVADLCQANLLEMIGEEAPPARGRPKKVYRMK